MEIFLDIIQYLSKFLKMNNLLMKNLNNYVKIDELIEKEKNEELNLFTILDMATECDQIINYNQIKEEVENYYKFYNISEIDHPFFKHKVNFETTINQKNIFLQKYNIQLKDNNDYNLFINENIKISTQIAENINKNKNENNNNISEVRSSNNQIDDKIF